MAAPTKRSVQVGLAPAYQGRDRKIRRPQHTMCLRFRPYQIQPCMIAPVLPGESLKSALCQGQVWSQPLSTSMKNSGWWFELFVFYVKHRDLPGWEGTGSGLGHDLVDMFVTNESLATYKLASANVPWYCGKDAINYQLYAHQRVVDEYFRDEGEQSTDFTVSGIFAASIRGRGQGDGFEHLTTAAAYQDRRQKLDADADGTIYMNEIEKAWGEWAAARDAGLVDMDYEDWLRSYGGGADGSVAPDRVDYHKPELIGYLREFTYPTNTVDPVTGTPAVAAGWRYASRIGKRFFFPEPGWLCAYVVVRPKVYLSQQRGALAGYMTTRNQWLPAVLNDQMDVSHILHAASGGPLDTTFTAAGYWTDTRDLLLYGDQFVNFAYTPASDGQFVSLPSATAQKRYVVSADVDQMFKDTTADKGVFELDGVISLNILGRQAEAATSLTLGRG